MEFPLIDPVDVELGPLVIRWYALAYLAGFVLGWRYALLLADRMAPDSPTRTDIDDFLIWAIPAVILGGRFGYVFFYNPDYFAANPLDAFKIWQGGMAFHGGLLGMVLAMIVFARIRAIALLRLSDVICCVAPIGLFFGRMANFINAELYGRVTDVSWGIIFPGTDGQPRHPSQLYQAALEGLLIFAVLFALVRLGFLQNRPGLISTVFLMLYGAARFIVEFFREPDAHIGLVTYGLSMGQLLSLPMVLIGAVLMVFAVRRHDPR